MSVGGGVRRLVVSTRSAERAVHAGKLRAAADWFTDCKTLTLERLPVGFIAALQAGADALESSPSPGAVETPELAEVLDIALDCAKARLEQDGCDCGDANDPPCALCLIDRVIALRSGGSR